MSSKGLEIFSVVVLLIVFGFLLFLFIGNIGSDGGDNVKKLVVRDVEDVPPSVTSNNFINLASCPFSSGTDGDKDGVIDLCDNCPDYYNPEQRDDDRDGKGNACDLTTHSGRKKSESSDKGECELDSDCGSGGLVGDKYCSGGDVAQLFESFSCDKSGTKDSMCLSDEEERIIEECDSFCNDGECKDFVCEYDSDCEDDDALTFDKCVNPGTEDADCENTPIDCASDENCEDGGFVGDLFCINDDIFQGFEQGMCVDPGLLNASCGFDIVDVFVESCDYACGDGLCVRCDENLDCDDGDSLTYDSCILPGTVLSDCVHEPIGECTAGETQSCGVSDVGTCEFGVQTCQGDGTWGSCVGAVDPVAEVCDGLDNDCDGESDEGNVCAVSECNDGIDNDGDGYIDFPADPSCSSESDDSESPFDFRQCNNGIDDDGDGFIDFPDDAGCSSLFDNTESPFNWPECDDGLDNDGDGFIDFPSDPNCINLLDNSESQ